MNKDNFSDNSDYSNIIFITGGTKSGKSEFAEHIAKKYINLTYIALSKKRPKDEEWNQKIAIHRQRRPENWTLIETTDLIGTLNKVTGPILIDSIGGFVMEFLDLIDKDWLQKTNTLIDLLQKRTSITLIVGEQVGWSLVSEFKIGNIYIERIGDLQKKITKISNENWLAINGRAIKIDEISLEIPS
tara:strand:+ start:1112 stop:1672 length:561 start_codon:yes stop_codon:yes gene_type:complete